MLYGVFSDVHSNLEALAAVLDFFESSRVEGHICCGDVVGYGPDPNECVRRVSGLKGLRLVCGNHDLAAVGRMDPGRFSPAARAGALWTRCVLSGEARGFLEALRPREDFEDCTLVHGTPRQPADEYLLSRAQFRQNLPAVGVWPLFFGHSHLPLCFFCRSGARIESAFLDDRESLSAKPSPQSPAPAAAFNPGSVGQPRDGDPRAGCALWDPGESSFQVFRLSYDWAATQAKIRGRGLPESLAARLACGQ